MVNHRHGGNNRIYRKHSVKNQDLRDNAPKTGMFFLVFRHRKLVVPFQPLVQLGRGFIKQENTAGKHNDVFTRHRRSADTEQRMSQRHDVRHKRQHNNADEHRQPQPRYPRPIAPVRFDLIGEDSDENQVVYTQNHFEHKKRCKAYPSMRFG